MATSIIPAIEVVPTLDLHNMSQSELLSLAASAASSFDLSKLAEVVPTIDRSIFNESSGSRKQTYTSPSSPNPTSTNPNPIPRRRGRPRLHPSPAPAPPPSDPSDPSDNIRIVSCLRRLFGEEPEEKSLALVVSDPSVVPATDSADREVRNGKGEVVDLGELGMKGDALIGEELRRRTLGLTTEDQILGYVAGLDGEWGSRRRKRKSVDGAVFWDGLPRGWKLLLWLKKKDGEVFLDCRRLISPTGIEFKSCKEVSSYIISLIGGQNVGQPSDQHEASACKNSSVIMSASSDVVNRTPTEPSHKENHQMISYPHRLFESSETNTEKLSKEAEVNEIASVSPEVGDREVRNGKGEVINLTRLAENGDLFGEEIRSKTSNMTTADQFLDYMRRLEGQWGSSRKKRKIVDSSIFGDKLPKGWKVLLGLKRKRGSVYLNCRSYVSPSGKQFMSCQEVSSYILSLVGPQEIEESVPGQLEASSAPNSYSVPLLPLPSSTFNNISNNDVGQKENLQITSYSHESVTASQSMKFNEVKEGTSVVVDAGDWEVRNGKGDNIDLVRLAEKADLFMEEIRVRTEKLTTDEQIMDYMKGLEGHWGSTRKRRKIVDASIFGDDLPRGWKVLLGLKKKDAGTYLSCLRYVSPSGKAFRSCKEVSSYISSLVGCKDVQQPVTGLREASSSSLHNPLSGLPPSSSFNASVTVCQNLVHKENIHNTAYRPQVFESKETVTESHSKKAVMKETTPLLAGVVDREVRNGKGEVINLIQLVEKGDLFGEEIRKKTEGLKTEEELLGYMRGLEGLWGSTRKRRRIVDAGIFGDDLPMGWKVLLEIKKKDGMVYLNCRNYVSPSGKQFKSCKDVASYIHSLVGVHGAPPITYRFDEGASRPILSSERIAVLTHHDVTNKEMSNCYVVAPISYNSAECERPGLLERVEKPGSVELDNILECRKCKIKFEDKDAHVHHMMTSHGRSAKRRKLGTSLGDVIIKDGVFECQFCHKTFTERHRYSGHVGTHVRYQSLPGGTPSCAAATGTSNSSSTFVHPDTTQTDIAMNKEEETNTVKPVDEMLVDSSNCRSVLEKNESVDASMLDVSEDTNSVTAGRGLEKHAEDCNVDGAKLKGVAKTCDTTDIKSPSCIDVTFPSVPNVEDVPSAEITQETSIPNSYDVKSSTSVPSVVRNFETVDETLPPSDMSIDKSLDEQDIIDGKSEVIADTSKDKTIANLFVDSQSEDLDMTEYNSGDNACTMSVKSSKCYDSLPASPVDVTNAALGASSLINSPLQTSLSASQYRSGDEEVEVENSPVGGAADGCNYAVESYGYGNFTSSPDERAEINENTNAEVEAGSCGTMASKDIGAMQNEHISSFQAADLASQYHSHGQNVEVEDCPTSPAGISIYGVQGRSNGTFTSLMREQVEGNKRTNAEGEAESSRAMASKDSDRMSNMQNDPINSSFQPAICASQYRNGDQGVEIDKALTAPAGKGSSYAVPGYSSGGMFTSLIEEHVEINEKSNAEGSAIRNNDAVQFSFCGENTASQHQSSDQNAEVENGSDYGVQGYSNSSFTLMREYIGINERTNSEDKAGNSHTLPRRKTGTMSSMPNDPLSSFRAGISEPQYRTGSQDVEIDNGSIAPAGIGSIFNVQGYQSGGMFTSLMREVNKKSNVEGDAGNNRTLASKDADRRSSIQDDPLNTSLRAISACQYRSGSQNVEVETGPIAPAGSVSAYGAQTYSNGIGMFTSLMEDVEINEKTNKEDVAGSSHTLAARDTGALGTMHNDRNISYFFPNFPAEQRSDHGDSNKAILEEFDDVGFHNFFRSSNSGREDATAGDIINDDDGGLALQLNVASNSSSWVQSSHNFPILDMIPDQGADELDGLGPDNIQQNMSGFEELRLGSMDPTDFDLMSAQASGSGPVSRSPIEFLPSSQLQWSLSLPSMNTSIAATFACVWCGRPFINEDRAAEPQSGTLGYMCPECKARISGQYGGFP